MAAADNFSDSHNFASVVADPNIGMEELREWVNKRIREYEVALTQESGGKIVARVDEFPEVIAEGESADLAIASLYAHISAICTARIPLGWEMPPPKRDRASVLASVRMTPKEREQFREFAIRNQMTLSEFLRRAAARAIDTDAFREGSPRSADHRRDQTVARHPPDSN